MASIKNGYFVISLDFELQWGVLDHVSINSPYRENIKNVRIVIPRLLEYFNQWGIHATFAAVGMLFHKDFQSLASFMPALFPSYANQAINPYTRFKQIMDDEQEYYLASDLIQMIKAHRTMEIASHTYSHYYCLEPGQTAEQFKADLQAAIKIAQINHIDLKSIVFPRNQVNSQYLEICSRLGISSVRTNETGWLYRASATDGNILLKRLFRLLDTYINLTGYHCSDHKPSYQGKILEIPSSRFLRPYNSALAHLEFLKLHRIKQSMTHAAKHGKIFHIWWHPHNFGKNTDENFKNLEEILKHYQYLNKRYNFTSLNLSELARSINFPNS